MLLRPTRNECTAQIATTVQCVYSFPLSPDGTDAQDLRNSSAGAWHFKAKAVANDGDSHRLSPGAPLSVKRHVRLDSADATPEPVDKGDKGDKLTITGWLRRANWDTNVWGGYTGKSVTLQFRKSGTDTVKTVTTDSAGELRTTVTANTTGTWRWRFTAPAPPPRVRRRRATGSWCASRRRRPRHR